MRFGPVWRTVQRALFLTGRGEWWSLYLQCEHVVLRRARMMNLGPARLRAPAPARVRCEHCILLGGR